MPSIDELLSAYHLAMGGLEANRKVTTRRIEGTISILGMAEPAKLTTIQKAPNLCRTVIEATGMKIQEGHDGKVMWKSNPSEGTVELEGAEKLQKLPDYQFYKYLDLKADYKTLTLKGRETMKGTLYNVLEATSEDGSVETFYFDTSSHHLSMVKRADVIIAMSDYRKIEGIAYPAKTVISLPSGPVVVTMTFDQVTQGIEIDDSIFSKPAE